MAQELTLSLKLQPKQSLLSDKIENSVATLLGYGGSRGGGKSGALRRLMLLRRLKYPGTTGIIFRRVYDDLKKNHIDKFFEEFPHLYRFYKMTDKEIVLPAVDDKAPSRIIFMYAETEAEVKRKFHGPEFMDMFIDQAEQLSEIEITYMKMCCRWPGVRKKQCKFVVFFNPGGIGLAYFKRVFGTKEYRGKEKPEDFDFIQAYGWDNVEWVRSALVEDGITEEDFYQWDSPKRFDYFVNRSQYGQELDRLPQALRIGHLLGSLDQFAGQYFDIWDPDKFVKRVLLTPWQPRWLSVDWGFGHPSAVLWHTQDGEVTRTYREYVRAGLGPRALAQEIVDASTDRLTGNKEKIDAIYLSPDAFAKRTTEDPIAHQMGSVFRQAGLPYPRAADDDRVSGWALMYDMLQYGQWTISPDCKELCNTLPNLSRDEEKNIEDCVKFDGDDACDSARYGIKSRFSSREMPKELQLVKALNQTRQILSDKGRDQAAINTAVHLSHVKFESEYRRTHKPVRRIRNWRASAN